MSAPILELPVQSSNRTLTRSAYDVRGMGVAVQANLVQLRVRQMREGQMREGQTRGSVYESMVFEHPVTSPGTVRRFRETLIDREHLKRYSQTELLLRAHEVWGQFCVLRWAFERGADRESTLDFVTLPESTVLRCDAALAVKLAEISGSFWRIRFEQRRRERGNDSSWSSFSQDQSLAASIPVTVFGRPVSDASADELLCASCEFVGMLSALRWVVDRRRVWGEPGIGEIGDRFSRHSRESGNP